MKNLMIASLTTLVFMLTSIGVSCQMASIKNVPAKVQVLNFGTFHMGQTSDANSVDFDEKNQKNQEEVHKIAKMISEFKPTVIIVETVPEQDSAIQAEYKSYCNNPDMKFEHPSEIELLAYEIGRLSQTERIYGIDHKMGYNYRIGNQIENTIDAEMHDDFYENMVKYIPVLGVDENKISLLEKLKMTNSATYLDFLIMVNADMLTHAGTNGNFEGADEAARYYQRNLRMYSNMNRLELDENDRVFVLMGASHTAFFRDFISRSPKYKMVDTQEYLNLK